MNTKKVPQLFVATGASKWGDPKEFPWTMGFQPDYHTEAMIYAKHILANVKDAKIGVLNQNDDYGKDYFDGFKEGPGQGRRQDRQGRDLRGDRSDGRQPDHPAQGFRRQRLLQLSGPKSAAQAIRKAADIDWKPAHYLNNVSASVAAVMKPAGFENAQGIITAAYLMDPTDKQWDNNAEMKAWRAWMDKWMPGANKADANHIYAYAVAFLMERDAEAVRRRPDARQPDEAGGGLPEAPRAAAAAGHHRQHQPDRLLSDPGGAACSASRARPGSCSARSCSAESS